MLSFDCINRPHWINVQKAFRLMEISEGINERELEGCEA